MLVYGRGLCFSRAYPFTTDYEWNRYTLAARARARLLSLSFSSGSALSEIGESEESGNHSNNGPSGTLPKRPMARRAAYFLFPDHFLNYRARRLGSHELVRWFIESEFHGSARVKRPIPSTAWNAPKWEHMDAVSSATGRSARY